MTSYSRPKILLYILAFGGFLLLLLITLLHHQAPLFDEPLFIRNMPLFNQYGLSRKFLLEMNDQAPGPLYQLVHYPLQFITHMQPPGLRLVNIGLLIITTFLLLRIIMRMQHITWKDALLPALNIIGVPMIWLVSGLALTEMPPICFAMLAVLLLQLALLYEKDSLLKSYLLALVAGVALGLAILGRSPFLVMIPAAGFLLLGNWTAPRRWGLLALYAAVALAMCMPVFLIWGGLVPPKQAIVSAGGIKPWHGILALAYGALVVIIIAPRWFYFSRRILLLMVGAYAVLLLLNITVLHYEYAPLSEAVGKVAPHVVSQFYPFVISPLLLAFALYFCGCTLVRAWEQQTDHFFLFLLASAFLLLASCLKVTHLFSSRYVAQAAPFFVLVLLRYDKVNYAKCIRFALGMLIGLLSMETYFNFH